MENDAPSITDLEQQPTVRAALEAAWSDSQSESAERRHEEGGWIYQDLITREIAIRRGPPGIGTAIVLDDPPIVEGSLVVGVFHTHPNPSSEGWNPGPSPADRRADERDGIPDLIRADNGVYHPGPTRRRGGLTGNAGYPG